jgi:hypothetical protein
MGLQFIGSESQINGTTLGNQRAVSTAALANGGYVTVWASDIGDGSGKAIMGQLFAADGSKVGAEFLINTTTAGDQDLPEVVSMPGAPLDPNVFFVVWQSAEAGGSVIRARRFLEDGTAVRFAMSDPPATPATDVVVSGSLGGSKPTAGLYGSGRLAFVWEAPSGDGSGTAIAMAQYRFSLGAPVVVNTTTAGNQVDPQVGARAGGGLGIVWESQEPAGDVIRGRVIFPVDSPSSDTLVSDGVGEDESLPNFSRNGNLAIWNSGTSIKAAALPLSGGAEPSIVLNATPGGVVSRSDIIALADGTYLAVYFTQSGDDGSSYSLRVERFSSTGQSMSAELLVPEKFTGVQEAPSIVQLANGNIVISWASEADELGNFEVKQRLLDLKGPEIGDSGDDMITGTENADVFLLQQGGNDKATGLGGNDLFIFGATLTSQDWVSGGAGRDQIEIQGDYTGANALTLGTSVVDVESLVLVPGNDTSRGDPGTNSYSYDVTTVNQNVAAGQQMVVSFSALRVGENVTFNGSAETDGSFLTYGGLGIDILTGGQQSDGFYFGGDGRFGSGDRVDGQGGSSDQLGLQGDYSGVQAISFDSNSIANIEMIVLLSAVDNRFGGGSAGAFSYDITMHNGNVAAGAKMYINANTLRLGENVTFDGSAETDGSFMVYGGLGLDTLTGGQQSDGFYFGADGRFGSGDRVDGRGGSLDQLGLQGDYSGAGAISFASDSMANIEMLVLLGAGDNRFGGGSGDGFSYDIIMHDSNVAAGATMYISANTLRTDATLTETLDFDGSAEKDGFFIVYAGTGADTIVGGQGADEIWGRGGADVITGGLGADILRGGEGNDVFDYNNVAESGPGSRDSILDFTSGSDRLDLSGIDADSLAGGDQAFSFIGSNAFAGSGASSAGQLRAYQSGSDWFVEGDTDGDGNADLVIQVTADALVSGDFLP